MPHFVDAVAWKVVFILRDHSHISPDNTGFCEHCGQPLPVAPIAPNYGTRRTNRTGIAVTILLHLLLVAIYLLQPQHERHAAPPSGATMVLLSPLTGKPKPKEQQSKPTARTTGNKTPRKKTRHTKERTNGRKK